MAEFWGERNFVRPAIAPVVFNYLDDEGNLHFSYNQKIRFQPESLQADKEGFLWHPFRDDLNGIISNELLTNLLDSIKKEGSKMTLNYREKQY